MKNKDIIKYNYKTHAKTSRTMLTSVIICFSLALIFAVFTVLSTMINYTNFIKNESFNYRMLWGDNNDFYSLRNNEELLEKEKENFKAKMENEEHVLKYYGYDEMDEGVTIPEFETDKIMGRVTLQAATEKSLPPLVKGTTDGLENNKTMICPQKYLGNSKVSGDNLTRRDMIDMSKFLGQEVTINYGTQQIKVKIGGLYDSFKEFIYDDICFVSSDIVKNINNTRYGNDENYQAQPSFRILVDDVKNVNRIIDKYKNEYNFNPSFTFDYEEIFIYIITCGSITVISFIFIVVFLYIYIKKSFADSANEIGMLKTLGYTNETIKKVKLYEMYMVSSLGLISAVILYTLGFFVAKCIQYNMHPVYLRLDIGYNWIAILVSALGLILLSRAIIKSSQDKIASVSPVSMITTSGVQAGKPTKQENRVVNSQLFVRLFKRKKNFKYYLCMFTLAILFLITLSTINYSLNIHLESMTEVISNRTLALAEDVPIETVRSQLKDVKHIESIENQTIFEGEKVVVIVDKSRNTDRLIKDVREKGYNLYLYDMTVKDKTETFVKAQNITVVMIELIAVLTVVILLSLFGLLLKEEHYNVAIMKTIGYRNRDITKTFFIQIGHLMKVAFSIAIPSGIFVNVMAFPMLFEKLCSAKEFLVILAKSNLLVVLGMVVLLGLSISINYMKIRKVTPTKLFRE